MFLRSVLFLFLCSFIIQSCKEEEAVLPETDVVKEPGKVDPHVSDYIKTYFTSNSDLKIFSNESVFYPEKLASLYSKNKYNALWSSNANFNVTFYSLLHAIQHSRYYFGLPPETYHYNELKKLSDNIYGEKSFYPDAAKLGQADLLMTDAFIKLMVHVNKGRISIDSVQRFSNHSQLFPYSIDSLFAIAFKNGSVLRLLSSLEPPYEQYHLLKRSLREFIAMHENQKWTALPDIKKDTSAYMLAAKTRMKEMGYYDSTAKGNDSVKLAKAFKKFQKVYRLTEDGKIGKEMIKALALDLEGRIRQIELNMERWRIEKPITDKKHVWVNLPGFYLQVAEEDSLVMESKIVCGDYKHHTPLLKSKIINILIYPYWNVPKNIAVKEILPRIKWDTSYLAKNNFEVINWRNQVVDHRKINWKKYSKENLPFRFRQRMGEDNSLGIMKFNFYNKYDIYIHDTNAKKAFKKEVRALSHGCVRLEDYFSLATFLIRDDSLHYKPDSLLLYIQKEEQKRINLKKPVSLFIKYFTAEVKQDTLRFYPDIYDRDLELIKGLYK